MVTIASSSSPKGPWLRAAILNSWSAVRTSDRQKK